MSYCRSYDDNHEVYLYGDVNGFFCCCGCKMLRRSPLTQTTSVWMLTRSEVLLHLELHRLKGHKFPKYVEKNIRKELREQGETFVVPKRSAWLKSHPKPVSFQEHRQRIMERCNVKTWEEFQKKARKDRRELLRILKKGVAI